MTVPQQPVSQMLEKVSRAICVAAGCYPDERCLTVPDGRPTLLWVWFIPHGEAAITACLTALLDLDEGTVEAGRCAQVPIDLGNGTSYMVDGLGGGPSQTFRKMIQHILNEGGEM